MIFQIKLNNNIFQEQSSVDGFHSLFRFAQDEDLLYLWEDFPAKLLSHDFPSAKGFLVETNLCEKKWQNWKNIIK